MVGWPIRRKLARFERDCQNPEAVQWQLLQQILARQSATAFGRDHHFQTIQTLADYRRQVPIAPYEYVAPYIDRVQRGETDALIADDKVLLFALTSGTTAARKLIPITTRYLADYRRGWNFWGVRAYRDHRDRKLFLRPLVQMVGDPDEYRTPAGIPCGNLTGFTAMVQKRMIRWLYAVPALAGTIKDSRSRYYLALRLSLPRPCAMFLAANPSTLVMLGRTLDLEKERLIRDIADGTLSSDIEVSAEIRQAIARKLKPNPEQAAELTATVNRLSRLYPQDVWHPDTTLIGTWTGGSMTPYLRQLPQFYGEPPIRDLGLLASEGRMTIPFTNHSPAGVLDIWSHHFEFVPEAEAESTSPTVLGVHELKDGESYFIVPTTASGLYRYQISDLVRVRGFLGKTPMVEFLGKGNRFANLTGEKLSEHHVTQAMVRATERTGHSIQAYAVAPIWNDERPYYGLFAEGECSSTFVNEMERALSELNIEYAAKRESERLGPLQLRKVEPGFWAKFDRERLQQTGGSPEQYKRPALIGDLKFAERVTGVN